MNQNIENKLNSSQTFEEKSFEGLYGTYTITLSDYKEVQNYRIAVFISGLSFFVGWLQWLMIGPELASLWMLPMSISLGLALNWIHIYIRELHQALQLFWIIGCISLAILAINFGPELMLSRIASQGLYIWAIGPFFAALAGLGFKEFFCFRRVEAIGLTLLIPLALIGHMSNLINGEIVMTLLGISALLLLILSIRKFGSDVASDIGDKSVFEYLKKERSRND